MKIFYLSASFVFILDRITKYLILQSHFEKIELLPILNLVKAWNKGIAFGIFHSASEIVSLFLFLIIPIFLILLLIFAKKSDNTNKFLFGILFGGGLGNWVDRLTFGAVLDFIDLHLGNFHWPAFNVADLGLTIGLIILLIRYVFKNS